MVGADESAFHPYTTLQSALGTLPGLVLQDSFGGFDPPRITVRGSGLQSAPVSRGVVLRLDGLPLNLADGSFNSALLEPALAGYFATRRGIADPVAATSALGGSIELGLPRDVQGARLLVMAGSQGLRRGIVAGGQTSKNTAVWAGVSHTQSDGFRENNAQSRTVVAATLDHQFTPELEFRINLFAANPHLDVPGPLTREAALHEPGSILPVVAVDKPRRETDVLRLGFELDWRREDAALRAAAGLQTSDDMFRQLRANGISRSTGRDLTLALEGRRGLGDHALYAGAHGMFGGHTETRSINAMGAEGPAFADLRLRAHTLTAWLDDTWWLRENVAFQIGASFGNAGRQADANAGSPAATPSGEVNSRDVAPRIGLTWRPQKESQFAVFTAWSRGLEPPTFDDLLQVRDPPSGLTLAFNPLDAQQADVIEAGVRGGNDTLRFELTAYHAEWSHELLRLADETGNPLGTMNAAPTTHRGIEGSLRWRLLQGERTLDLILSHTWSEAEFDDDPVFGNNRLAGLPPHAGAGEIQFADRRGPFAAIGASWIGGSTYADHANQLAYDGSFLVNARTGWRDPNGWTLYLEVSNVFDEHTIASTAGILDIARNPPATTIFLPGAPRRVNAGFEWRW